MKGTKRVVYLLIIGAVMILPATVYGDCKDYPFVTSVSFVGPCMTWCDKTFYKPRTESNKPKADACKDACAKFRELIKEQGDLLRVNNL